MEMKELNDLKNEVKELPSEALKHVNGGKKPWWDTSIQDESVPVRNGDPCPRCPDRVQIFFGADGKPLYLFCPICAYTYTPTDGKFYSFDL